MAGLLAVVLVFGLVVRCGSSGDSPSGSGGGTLKVPITLELEENTYSDGYQGFVDVGTTIKKNDEWVLDVKFTSGGSEGGEEESGLFAVLGGTVVAAYEDVDGEMAVNQPYYVVKTADLANADYFVFITDGSQAGAKKDGLGGLKIWFQGNGGSDGYAVSTGTTSKDWTSMNRAGVCYFLIKLSEIDDKI